MNDDQTSEALATREAFATKLRSLRTSQPGNVSQAAFARDLGIPGDRPGERYALYELAKREPPLWILAAIRRRFGASLDVLVADRQPPLPQGNFKVTQSIEEAEWLEIFQDMEPDERNYATRLLRHDVSRSEVVRSDVA